MADGSSSAAELEKAQGMKRSTSLQSNLSSHTHSSSSSTQRFDSSSDSLALADSLTHWLIDSRKWIILSLTH